MHDARSVSEKKGLNLSFIVGKGAVDTGKSGSDQLILLLPAVMNVTLETERDQENIARRDIKAHKT